MAKVPYRPAGPDWVLYRCVNARGTPYLTEGELYWLQPTRNGWLEDIGCSRFAAFRFENT